METEDKLDAALVDCSLDVKLNSGIWREWI
jgi:hypothetical protein